jgi:predicted  nucleic acid-binding Zn-ribbon protein
MHINHTCSACGSEFGISYDEMHTETDPNFCPFCGEYLILDEDDFNDKDLHDDEDEEPL